MSPVQNINDNSPIPQSANPIMNSYIVHVGEQTFRLYRSSVTFDSPNFFTQTFLSEEETSGETEISNSPEDNVTSLSVSSTDIKSTVLDNKGKENDSNTESNINNDYKTLDKINKARMSTSTQTYFSSNSTVKEITIDRDPRLFEVILRYLRGYTIFPLSSVNLPQGMSLDLFRESLLEDARFYGLDRLEQLLQAETPSPLSYKDPFTSADKILLSLRDVLIHKDFIKSKLDGSSTIEFFTGAVLTIEISDGSIIFQTKFLNAQDQKAMEVLDDICGENSHIQLSRKLNSNMHDTLNGIRLEIDGVQITGMDIASLVEPYNQRVKTLDDMFRLSGGKGLVVYAQEFVFRLDKSSDDINNENSVNGVNGELNQDHDNKEEIKENNGVINVKNNVSNEGNPVYLGVVWAKGWTQEWWAWNEYRMKLDALQ
ncbi:1982_t:CDS:1 [Diversispora eburnea]|uniref:1982_t:CDS:1 n=2 Tax=Diversisporales TaxID=214509 RepID=A0A9N8WHT6_9GLOM|nr:1982_t:CDS:1 [Diversispora eburnea]CAG8512395.1 7378_t:CDS:1 [Dentiscutata erythropus]